MDAAFSGPVSSLRPLPFLSPNPNPTKDPPLNHLLLLLRPQQPPPSQTPSSLLSLPSFPTLAPKPRPPPPPPTSTLPSSASAHGPVHRRAATGYAAALADAALCAGALGPAARCARRLALRAERPLPDPAAAAAEEEEGGLERHVAAMVRLLVGKGRAGMVAEVVAEFVRICDELGATETVVVEKQARRRGRVKRISEETKMRPSHLFAV
ncbi:CASP-like protein 4U1 [Ananas comosus]|uniref:CASP-like protein 4U1 n=1 Tax=Ananas comosus TaxID=4615 RepID=A0A6P5GYK5_ANACO|nr:CASP-like protein 4U1 [Ananas comosus]